MMSEKAVILWQGKWDFCVESVPLADGSVLERGMVVHPGAVVLIPLIGEDVVMIRQFRPILNKTILELPAGTRDPDEEIAVCAQRELREETGYRAETLIELGGIYASPGFTDEVLTLFLATGLTHDPLPMDADEEIENVIMPLVDVVEMAWSGAIPDAKTTVGILRAHHYLLNQ